MNKLRGFSLIEVTVSIFIMGVILFLLQAILQSGALTRMSKHQSVALSIAQNKIESLRAGGYATLPSSGTFSDSLINELPVAATTTLTVSVYNAETKQVSVNVVWRDPGSTASSTVSLSTLITEIGGLP